MRLEEVIYPVGVDVMIEGEVLLGCTSRLVEESRIHHLVKVEPLLGVHELDIVVDDV